MHKLKFRERCYKSAKKSVKEFLRSTGDFLVRQSTLPDQPVQDPGAHIPDHRGHVKGLLRAQLAMRVPREREKCFLRVEDNVCNWEEGKLLVFDDTYRHEVQNNTDEERIVLLLHFDRPMNRLGRLTNACLMAVIRRTPFVKKAVRNHSQWEDQFRRQLAAAGNKTP